MYGMTCCADNDNDNDDNQTRGRRIPFQNCEMKVNFFNDRISGSFKIFTVITDFVNPSRIEHRHFNLCVNKAKITKSCAPANIVWQ